MSAMSVSVPDAHQAALQKAALALGVSVDELDPSLFQTASSELVEANLITAIEAIQATSCLWRLKGVPQSILSTQDSFASGREEKSKLNRNQSFPLSSTSSLKLDDWTKSPLLTPSAASDSPTSYNGDLSPAVSMVLPIPSSFFPPTLPEAIPPIALGNPDKHCVFMFYDDSPLTSTTRKRLATAAGIPDDPRIRVDPLRILKVIERQIVNAVRSVAGDRAEVEISAARVISCISPSSTPPLESTNTTRITVLGQEWMETGIPLSSYSPALVQEASNLVKGLRARSQNTPSFGSQTVVLASPDRSFLPVYNALNASAALPNLAITLVGSSSTLERDKADLATRQLPAFPSVPFETVAKEAYYIEYRYHDKNLTMDLTVPCILLMLSGGRTVPPASWSHSIAQTIVMSLGLEAKALQDMLRASGIILQPLCALVRPDVIGVIPWNPVSPVTSMDTFKLVTYLNQMVSKLPESHILHGCTVRPSTGSALSTISTLYQQSVSLLSPLPADLKLSSPLRSSTVPEIAPTITTASDTSSAAESSVIPSVSTSATSTPISGAATPTSTPSPLQTAVARKAPTATPSATSKSNATRPSAPKAPCLFHCLCRYGLTCTGAHTPAEIRMFKMHKAHNPKAKTKPCKFPNCSYASRPAECAGAHGVKDGWCYKCGEVGHFAMTCENQRIYADDQEDQ